MWGARRRNVGTGHFRRRAFFPLAAGVGFGSGWDYDYPYSYSYGDPCVVWTGYGWINICY